MTVSVQLLDKYMAEMPLIAILRGVKPEEVLAHAEVIVKAGWRCIEIPMNSPDPFESIKLLVSHYKDQILIGGGTVVTMPQLDGVNAAGGKLAFAPNTNTEIIAAATMRGMAVVPGFYTPSEAFAGYHAGARYLKLFPAEGLGSSYIKAIRSVLPPDAKIVPVGGIGPDNVAEFIEAGSAAFGIGSQLYKAGRSVADVSERANAFTAALRANLKRPAA